MFFLSFLKRSYSLIPSFLLSDVRKLLKSLTNMSDVSKSLRSITKKERFAQKTDERIPKPEVK